MDRSGKWFLGATGAVLALSIISFASMPALAGSGGGEVDLETAVEPAPRGVFEITRVIPRRVEQGTSVSMRVRGSGFVDGGTMSLSDPAGVTIGGWTVVNAELIRLSLTVADDAALGRRDLQWTNPDDTLTIKTGAFRVFAPVVLPEYSFVDVTAEAGVANEGFGHFGVTFSDFDKDGWLDIYCANGADPGTPHDPEDVNVLYRNNGDGTFSDVTAATAAGDSWVAMRNVWADYDRDGDLDFYSHNFERSTLYRNDDGVFVDANDESGAGLDFFRGTGAAWGDYDNDGWLDLHATMFPDGFNALLHNNGDGTFTEQQPTSGLEFNAEGMGDAWVDFNLDGWLDISIAAVTPNDYNFLYKNNGDGTFTPVTASAGIVVEEGSSTSAITWGDYDNDGWYDMLVTEVALGSEKTLPERLYLFRNNRDETFTEVTAAAGLSLSPDAREFWHASWADWDNDGDLDLFVGAEGPNSFFRNNGDGTFTDIAPELGVNFAEEGKGAAWGDYDNDGDLDLYIIQHQETGGPLPPNHLMRNSGGSNNWLQLELIGTCSNVDAIGARITLVANGLTQSREINGGTGFFDQHTHIQQFGLGSDADTPTVHVRWPSGLQHAVHGLGINTRHTIVEPDSCATAP